MSDVVRYPLLELGPELPVFDVHATEEEARRELARRPGPERLFDVAGREWAYDRLTANLHPVGAPDEEAARRAILAAVEVANEAISEDNRTTALAYEQQRAFSSLELEPAPPPVRPLIDVAADSSVAELVAALQAWPDRYGTDWPPDDDLLGMVRKIWRKIRR